MSSSYGSNYFCSSERREGKKILLYVKPTVVVEG